jgi:hypothetical protein
VRFPLPWQFWAVAVGLAGLNVGVSWMLARAGEPQSVWIWRDVLGVMQ